MYKIRDEAFDEYTETAVSLIKANVHKMRWNFGRARLLGASFDQYNFITVSSKASSFNPDL